MAEQTHPEPGPRQYVIVFIFLLIMTGLTTWISYFNLGVFNAIAAVLIAVIKAVAVVLVFMHVWTSSRLTKLTIVSGLFFLCILLVLTSADFISRPWSVPTVHGF